MPDFDTVMVHGLVVTMDDEFKVIRDGAVAFSGNSIAYVGRTDDLPGSQASAVIDCSGSAVLPGLINAHTHAPMTLLRGMADDLRLDVWLYGYMMPVERQFVSPDFSRLGTRLACAEMIRSGVTCFSDMYYFEEEVAATAAEIGLRGVCAETILKFPAPGAPTYEDSLAYSRDFISRWREHPLIIPAVGPHAPYTATPDMLADAIELANEFNVPLLTHLCETADEVEEAHRIWDMSPVQWVHEQGLFETMVVAAHCVHVDETDMRILARGGASVIHNPTSNLKLASGVAPVSQMLALGIPLGIGTDGTASNNDLDMFEEMRLAALIAKGMSGDPLAVPAKAALTMATRGGAKALGIGDKIGSLVPGKRADVVVVSLRGLHLVPKFDRDPDAVYSQLVYAAKSSDVQHVWVDGRALMRERDLLTLDVDGLRSAAQELAERIDIFLVARKGNVLDQLVAIGGVEINETFEVQVKVKVADRATFSEILVNHPHIAVVKPTVRRQYDTYFLFRDSNQGRLRYREDEVLDDQGNIKEVFYVLTLTGPVEEREYDKSVLLSRSRFVAQADRSLRFYREYFQPAAEIEVHKNRERYRIIYEDTAFAINLDQLTNVPSGDSYLEIKSRTWSRADAERKASLISRLLELFGVEDHELVLEQYFEMPGLEVLPTANQGG
jgi:5-methylthioadenosine/S-adenosylhomocysteine deaminase